MKIMIYGDYELRDLADIDLKEVNLADPALAPTELAKTSSTALAKRLSDHRNGRSFYLALYHQRQMRGWIGFNRMLEGYLETSIFLHPTLWGRQASNLLYSVLFVIYNEIMQSSEPLVASVNINNVRSIIAHERMFPDADSVELYEPNKRRWSRNFSITKPPVDAVDLPITDLQTLLSESSSFRLFIK